MSKHPLTEGEAMIAGALLPVALPLIIFAFAVPPLLVKAWVLTIVWGWYVVPTFGLSPLHLAPAFGLLVLLSIFRTVAPGDIEKAKGAKMFMPFVTNAVIHPALVLFLAWVGTWFL